MVTVIEGKGRFVVDGREYCLSAGETLVMPARKPHSVHAEDAFKNAAHSCVSAERQ